MKENCPLKENCSTTAITSIILLGVALAGAYYFIKKKREENKPQIRASFV